MLPGEINKPRGKKNKGENVKKRKKHTGKYKKWFESFSILFGIGLKGGRGAGGRWEIAVNIYFRSMMEKFENNLRAIIKRRQQKNSGKYVEKLKRKAEKGDGIVG